MRFYTENVIYDLPPAKLFIVFDNRHLLRNLNFRNHPQSETATWLSMNCNIIFELELLYVSLFLFQREFFAFGSV